jgi:two-component system, OmpR family, sensor kinase
VSAPRGSIRWTLLGGYTAILVLVIGGFGVAVSARVASTLLDEVDSELRAHGQAMAASLEPHSGGVFDLELSDDYVRYFQQPGDESPYYVVLDAKGEVVDRSRPDLELVLPTSMGFRERGVMREYVAPGPIGANVIVGRGTSDARHRLREWIGIVVTVGLIALAAALGLGWLLSGRVIAPIERMSHDASEITAMNLSRRLDLAGTKGELAQLATVLNQTFDRLEAAFDRQTRFTADASHELRTPLSILSSHLELALRKERTPEEYREAIETSLKAAQRMRAVVEGLLTLARADAGEPNLAHEAVDLRRVVDETTALLRPLADSKQVTLSLAAAGAAEKPVLGDPARLREVVMNLVTNAIKYNRAGGRVDVTLGRERAPDGRDLAVLAVADTGLGIPEKDQPHLFERFYRVDKARSREQGGSGLGLAITRWIVEAHDGQIGFTSREGEGTTFTVRLPMGARRPGSASDVGRV